VGGETPTPSGVRHPPEKAHRTIKVVAGAPTALWVVAGTSLRLEAAAKQLFGKDHEGAKAEDGGFMRGEGTHDPGNCPIRIR